MSVYLCAALFACACACLVAALSAYTGALFATLGLVVMSWIFSGFIAVSTRYPLVYGSLASLILLMLWLYFGTLILLCGAALNICIRDGKKAEGRP